jgi:vacuolar-type H+-ATPase subunit C/Vma6
MQLVGILPNKYLIITSIQNLLKRRIVEEGNSNSNDQVQIDIVLDRGRFNNLVDMCNKYKEQQGVELTAREYILMLIDSAISA